MNPIKYNESSLDILFKNISEKFDAVHKKLDAILDQTTSTNGRVSLLELWRSRIAGGLAVIFLFIVPILILLITKLVQAQ